MLATQPSQLLGTAGAMLSSYHRDLVRFTGRVQARGGGGEEEAGVQRLSMLAADNLERESAAAGDGWDGADASPAAGACGSDVHLHTADAELDFQAAASEPGAACQTQIDRPASQVRLARPKSISSDIVGCKHWLCAPAHRLRWA